MDRLTEFAGGNADAFQELADLYVSQTTDQFAKMEAALQAGSAQPLARLAHSCAGASSTCGMVAIVPPLRRLEALGNAGDLTAAAEVLAKARHEFDRIKQFLENRSRSAPQPCSCPV
jgi:HPt (histidine-containing phosphotransfer) domain-containing protein